MSKYSYKGKALGDMTQHELITLVLIQHERISKMQEKTRELLEFALNEEARM